MTGKVRTKQNKSEGKHFVIITKIIIAHQIVNDRRKIVLFEVMLVVKNKYTNIEF